MKTIIIGGVAGGMSAATRLRRLDEHAEILVLERGDDVSFANCGLPFHLSETIAERDSLVLQTPAALAARFRLDVRVRHEVTAIDRAAGSVRVRDRAAGAEWDEPYDRLIIAAGVDARAPRADGPGPTVRPLRTLPDLDALVAALAAARAAGRTPSALVLGAGFIGLEAAENLSLAGARVALVQRGEQVFPLLDPEMAAPLHELLVERGIAVHLGATAAADPADPGTWRISDGAQLRPDLVIDATGVAADLGMFRAAGLALGEHGGLRVDERHRTSDERIYAVGDVAEKRDAIGGGHALVTLAGLANRHGRAAADAIAGRPAPAAPALGTAIIGLFGLAAASVGWSERRLIAAGRPYRALHTHPASHAGYYPGAEQLAMKLLVEPGSERILGAQVVGRDGADKRIDVIATAMAGGLTASQLSELELAYAPQFGSAKDPVNLIGYVSENHASGAAESVQWHELDRTLAAGAVLVDVRTRGEFLAGSIPGAISAPLDELRELAAGLPPGRLIVHCRVGQRGHTAARILRQLGRDVANLDGGFLTWAAGTRGRG